MDLGILGKKTKMKMKVRFLSYCNLKVKNRQKFGKIGGAKKNFGPLPHKNDCNFAPVCAIFLIFCVWLSNNQLPLIAFIVHVLHCQYTPSRNEAKIFKMPPGGPRVKKKFKIFKNLLFLPQTFKNCIWNHCK